MNRRRAIAVLALLGILDSVYLLLAKLGYIGSLSCSLSHGCDLVNASRYSSFLGVPVAAIGLAGYLVLFVIAVAGTQERWVDDPRPDGWLAALSGLGLVFTLYLTYTEIFLLHSICQWCVLSQLVIVTIFVLAAIGVVSARRGGGGGISGLGEPGG